MHIPPQWPRPADGPANRPPALTGGRPQRPRLWLISGTGEGPPLAAALLARGWRLKVSVVTSAAARAYPRHPDLELAVGPLGAGCGESPASAVAAELRRARDLADPYLWLVDATHPFARQISAALAQACRRQVQPLLRLQRPPLPAGRAALLDDLADLGGVSHPGERMLLAIGARRMAEAITASPAALHHARVLPSPQALRQAMAVGLAPERLACLRPAAASLPVEIALCRRWRIDTVLCRQSGGESEQRWHRICEALDLRLLLVRRPPEPTGVCALPLAELLERIGTPGPD
jgi:precorrin-6A/cobalt-precorrin-6A reductase